MNKILPAALLAVITVCTLVFAQTTNRPTNQGQTNTSNTNRNTATAQQSGNVEQQLIQLDREWGEASQRGDIATLERILASGYVSTSGATGQTVTRAETLAQVRAQAANPSQDTTSYDDYTVQMHGDAAVLTHRTTVNTQEAGQPVTLQLRSMHVFVRRGGRWQAVYSQGTRIAPAPTTQPTASPSSATQPTASPGAPAQPQTSPSPATQPQASPSPAAQPQTTPQL